MILIKNAQIFSPEPLGIKDVLVGGQSILYIDESISDKEPYINEVVDAKGYILIPGLIDSHCHIAGAGGEGGAATRTPEMHVREFFRGGITTAVGCLGTDGITRDPRSVLMKAKAMTLEGVSTFMYTGAYQVPTPTIMGSIAEDVAMIEEVIGTGEIALSDHRSSFPTTEELSKIAAEARVGGMLGGKAGIVNIHMGDAEKPFQPIYDVVEKTQLDFSQFLPTHINRNDYIFEDAKTYGKKGVVDITASSYPYFPEYEVKPSNAASQLLSSGVPLKNITMSSDAGGSLPDFDENGNLVKLESGKPESLLGEFRDMITKEKMDISEAIHIVSTNVARVLKLNQKGRIQRGFDADLLILDENLEIFGLIARGEIITRDNKIIKKTYFD
jgi:beta-aspartyl-dipeptidase (metallo-type)